MSKACLSSLEMFLFRPVIKSGKTCNLIEEDKTLFYARTRELIHRKLKLVILFIILTFIMKKNSQRYLMLVAAADSV